MAQVTLILQSTPLFNEMPEAQLAQIARITEEKAFSKGQMIFSEGDDANGFYIVASGRIKIYKLSPEGKEQILHIFGAGEPFGEVPVFSGDVFPASAQAIAKSHLLFIPRSGFVDLITENPSMALNMLAVLARRLRQFTIQIENLSLKEVPGRLAAYLLYAADEQNTTDQVHLNISKGQLASLLGTIPETLSRIFSKMTNRGLIQVNGPVIVISDRQRLEDLAENGRLMD